MSCPGRCSTFSPRAAPSGTRRCRASRFAVPPIPGPRRLRYAKAKSRRAGRFRAARPTALPTAPVHPGSNNWALSGKQTADGRAIVANDMHLGIRVPHIWYRASFVWPEAGRIKDRTANYGPHAAGHAGDGRGQQRPCRLGLHQHPGGLGRRRADRRRSARSRFVPHAQGPAKVRASRRNDQSQERAGRHARRRRDDLGPGHRSRQQRPPSCLALGGPRYRGREHGPAASRIGPDA